MEGTELSGAFMGSIAKMVEAVVESKLGNVLMVKPVEVLSVSGTKADVKVLGDDAVLSNVEVYSSRAVAPGSLCHAVYWGKDGKRMSNMCVLFGGSMFR